ncbi:hypothetical protein G7046_g7003 [Stylonectria norvegica]|nr:hypothetical protein G7046_g7003 [Stylonectria norvegica]
MTSVMQRRMLSKADEEAADEVEVRREDQDKINKFSRLHQRELVLEDELDSKNKEKEELDDLSMELELADEDEKIQYKIGDAFFHVPLERAQEMLETATTKIEEETSTLEEKLGTIRDEMTQLKVELHLTGPANDVAIDVEHLCSGELHIFGNPSSATSSRWLGWLLRPFSSPIPQRAIRHFHQNSARQTIPMQIRLTTGELQYSGNVAPDLQPPPCHGAPPAQTIPSAPAPDAL